MNPPASASIVSLKRLALVLAVAGLLALPVVGIVFMFRLCLWPTHFGQFRDFFGSCATIQRGASTNQVLEAMRGYLLANRAGDRRVSDKLVAHPPRPSPDRSRDTDASFLFYPATGESANWCVVYFRNDLVVRGGTVVTATGSRRADVAIQGGRIAAIEADLQGPAATADEAAPPPPPPSDVPPPAAPPPAGGSVFAGRFVKAVIVATMRFTWVGQTDTHRGRCRRKEMLGSW